jgi:hypothetical protein
MKIRVSARDKTTGDVRGVEAEGPDYQTVKADLIESVPDDLQLLFIKADRPETFH